MVYKVDRLSRSLMDFSRIMETLDRAGCSFVSVTQHFNTTHSMGRLTLNILLSFAQFEREIISERTKDKMSAARRKGKWTGGSLILGYDLNTERTRLVINEAEAAQVRSIFRLYIETQSVLATAAELNRRGWPRKIWTGKRGTTTGGGPWNKPNLLGFLTNVTYIGKVAYGGELYRGEHEAILDEVTWAKAQNILTRNAGDRGASVRNKSGALLRGLLRCGTCGCSMTHSFSQKGNVRYRYYLCQTAMKRGWAECETRSAPAQEIEDFVLQRISEIGRDPSLAAEVARKAQEEHATRTEALRSEKEEIERNLRQQTRAVAGIFGQPDAAAQLADLQDQLRAGENRLSQIGIELAATGEGAIDEEAVAGALGKFGTIVAALTTLEKTRLLELLVNRVTYDRVKGTVAITFHPNGFESILEQVS